MKTIIINSFLSTNIESEFTSINTIEIEENSFGSGGFGEVYTCKSLNKKKPVKDQVIKLFKEDTSQKLDHNFETIQRLQKRIDKKNEQILQATGHTITDEYPALIAIPQFSFEGSLDGKMVRGFSSNNLLKMGFEEFNDILDPRTKQYKEYNKLKIENRLLIAYHLVSSFKILSELCYIHADLKPEAFFVNMNTNECAIIDYDSGAVTENVNDEPNTWGTPSDFLAPEIFKQLDSNRNNGRQTIKVNLLSDLWSVMISVHYIITTTHPLFFLTNLGQKVTIDYFTKYEWPNIDYSESYFQKINKPQYEQIVKWYASGIDQSIFKEFKNTINHGYEKPINRTTYERWGRALKSIQKPCKIEYFSSNRTSIIKGMPVMISWKVDNASHVIISNGIGKVNNVGQKEIYLNYNTNLSLSAESLFGKDSANVQINVFPTPVIKTIDISTPNIQIRNTINLSLPESPMITINPIGLNFVNDNSKLLENIKVIEYSTPIIPAQKSQKEIKKKLSNRSLKKQLLIEYEKIRKRVSKFFRD